jgi:hypothetical protein
MRDRPVRWLVLFVVLSCGGAGFLWWKICTDPNVVFLLPEKNAKWICFNRPFDLVAWRKKGRLTVFRKTFEVETVPDDAVLHFFSLRTSAVYLDGRPIAVADRRWPMEDWDWRLDRQVPLTQWLKPGRHELDVLVNRQTGRPALMAYCEALGIYTDTDWQTRQGTGEWLPAADVNSMRPTILSLHFSATREAFVACLPFLLILFFALFAGKLTCDRLGTVTGGYQRYIPSAGQVRWWLIGAWLLLAVNNIWKIPLMFGFDINEHTDYIRYVAENRSLPLASDGWQMFQSPFYYIVSAFVYQPLAGLFDTATVLRLLRIIPLACGIAQVEVSYRALKLCFPERGELQSLGTLIGGFLPMNLYMSQYAGNEPLAALLTAVTLLLAMQAIQQPAAARSLRWQIAIGVLLGLAMLTKATALLLVLPVAAALVFALRSSGRGFRTIATSCSRVFVIAGLLAGWYYLRNWLHFDKPFIGGWDPVRGSEFTWWQDPSYRTFGHFFNFGESLVRPIHSAFAGFWDSFYSTFWLDGYLSGMGKFKERPPWNYSLALSVSWLALIPVAAMLAGVVRAWRHPDRTTRRLLQFAAATIAIYLAAMLYLFLHLPVVSTAKASYTLGLIPCYAVLATAGLDVLMRGRLLRALFFAGIVCWAVFSYLAYFAY